MTYIGHVVCCADSPCVISLLLLDVNNEYYLTAIANITMLHCLVRTREVV